jgi:hypothetical protein
MYQSDVNPSYWGEDFKFTIVQSKRIKKILKSNISLVILIRNRSLITNAYLTIIFLFIFEKDITNK